MALTRATAARQAEIASRHPQAVQFFTEGLGSTLRQWTALELAVHHQWGGINSNDKAEALVNELVGMFTGPDKIYKDDVSLLLDEYMETNFYTICEDDSTDELGDLLVTMWRQCCAGDFTIATNALAREYVRHEMVSKSEGVVSGDVDDGSDEDDNEAMEENEEKVKEAAEGMLSSAGNTAAGMEVEGVVNAESQQPPDPVVDEDGFETVFRGKSKKKRGK